VTRLRQASEAELAAVLGTRLAAVLHEAMEKERSDSESGLLLAAEPLETLDP
jgi:hypothetical protein